MYVIIVYDVDVKRVSKVCNFLRCFLNWVQNSVFEGELTDSQFMRLESGLRELIEASTDSVRIYILRSADAMKVQTIGKEKANIDIIV